MRVPCVRLGYLFSYRRAEVRGRAARAGRKQGAPSCWLRDYLVVVSLPLDPGDFAFCIADFGLPLCTIRDDSVGNPHILGRNAIPSYKWAGGLLESRTSNQARWETPRRRGDSSMIQNDQELKVTRERIAYLLDLLARLRVTSRPEELALVSGGYRAEVERMQGQVLDYLTQPASQTTAKAG